jgi:tape measure domain-containing protein
MAEREALVRIEVEGDGGAQKFQNVGEAAEAAAEQIDEAGDRAQEMGGKVGRGANDAQSRILRLIKTIAKIGAASAAIYAVTKLWKRYAAGTATASAVTDALRGALKKIGSAASAVGTKAGEMGAKIARAIGDNLPQIGAATLKIGRFSLAWSRSHAVIASAGASLGVVVGVLGLVTAGLAAVIAVAKAAARATANLVRKVVDASSSYETLTVQLRAVVGSADGAAEALAWIDRFAAQTPMQIDGITTAFMRLQGAGLDPMDGTLQVLGDAVAAFGGGSREVLDRVIAAVSQIATKGKLSAEELQQLAEAQIPAFKILEEQLGLTGEQLTDIGNSGISAAEGLEAIFMGLDQRVGGAMASLMDTWSGLVSNLKDELDRAFRAVGGAGVMDTLKGALRGLLEQLQDLRTSGALEEFGRDLKSMVGALAVLGEALTGDDGLVSIVRAFGSALESLSRPLSAMIPLFDALGDAAPGIAEMAEEIGNLASVLVFLSSMKIADMIPESLKIDKVAYSQMYDREVQALQSALEQMYGSVERGIELIGNGTGATIRDIRELWLEMVQTNTASSQWQRLIKLTAEELKRLEAGAVGAADATEDLGDKFSGLRKLGGDVVEITQEMWGALEELERKVNSSYWAAYEDHLEQLGYWTNYWRDRLAELNNDLEIHQSITADIESMPGPLEAPLDYHLRVVGVGPGGAAERGLAELEMIERIGKSLKKTLGDAIYDGLTGRLDEIPGVFAGLGQQLNSELADALNASLFGGSIDAKGGLGDWVSAMSKKPMASILGGLGTIYAGTQGENRAMAALTGAIGGLTTVIGAYSAMGASAGGWGMAIGAIVGALVGWFGSSQSERPYTGATVGPEGSDIWRTTGHQGYGEERRTQWERAMNAVYNRIWAQFRSIAELGGDASLFDLFAGAPTYMTGGRENDTIGISAEDLAKVLADSVLPQEFAAAFGRLFRAMLVGRQDPETNGMLTSGLGVSVDAYYELQAALQALPGEDRLQLLTDYITTLRGLSDLRLDMADIEGRAIESEWDAWMAGYQQVTDQLEMYRAGWDQLNVQQMVTQGAKSLELLQTWYDNAVQYLASILDMQEQMQQGIDQYREQLLTRDLDGPDAGAYYQNSLLDQLEAIRSATDPADVQAAYTEAMRYLQLLDQWYQDQARLAAAATASLEELYALQDEVSGWGDALDATEWTDWIDRYQDLLGELERLDTTWADLSLADQVAAGQESIDLLGRWYQDAVSYMRSLIDLQQQMQGGIDDMRERLTTRGMSGRDLEDYLYGQYEAALTQLYGAQDPSQAQDAYDRAMGYLNQLDQYYQDNGYGQAGTDALLLMLGDLEQVMQTVMGGMTGTVEDQVDQVRQALIKIGEALEGLGLSTDTWADGTDAISALLDAIETAVGGSMTTIIGTIVAQATILSDAISSIIFDLQMLGTAPTVDVLGDDPGTGDEPGAGGGGGGSGERGGLGRLYDDVLTLGGGITTMSTAVGGVTSELDALAIAAASAGRAVEGMQPTSGGKTSGGDAKLTQAQMAEIAARVAAQTVLEMLA